MEIRYNGELIRGIIYKEDIIIDCDNIEQLINFIKSNPIFEELMDKAIIKIYNTKKFKTFRKDDLFKDIEFPTKLTEYLLLNPIDLAFSRLMGYIETKIGNKLLEDKNILYSDIISMQYVCRVFREYIEDKNLLNFTPQQDRENKRKRDVFYELLPDFKEYLKLII